jgi:hypothetical protein
MSQHRYVVLAQRLKGFDDFETAAQYAASNLPAVICERRLGEHGRSVLVEIKRYDFLYDAERDEWRVMLG